jgi:hypothetical protein
MSLTNKTTTAALSSYTGNPILDTAINQVVIVVGGFISALLVAYMSKHGVGDETLLGSIPTVIPTLLSTLITLGFAIWTVVRKKQSVNAIVDHSTDAAISGRVSDAVKALATPAQKATMARAGV